MTPEHQKILDKLASEWIRLQEAHQQWITKLAESEREILIAESKFKGVVAAFGGENWQWDGQHINFLPATPVAKSAKKR